MNLLHTLPAGTYQLYEVLRCPTCGRDTPHEFTAPTAAGFLRCCVCRTET